MEGTRLSGCHADQGSERAKLPPALPLPLSLLWAPSPGNDPEALVSLCSLPGERQLTARCDATPVQDQELDFPLGAWGQTLSPTSTSSGDLGVTLLPRIKMPQCSRICIYMYIYIHIYICMHNICETYIYIYNRYMCMYVYIYVCIYTHTYICGLLFQSPKLYSILQV